MLDLFLLLLCAQLCFVPVGFVSSEVQCCKDVAFYFDGVPFLLHDRTLKRTTNIDDVSPEMENVDASMLPWSRLEELNAGEWFLEKKQFLSMPHLSLEDEELAKKQKIFKFSDFLKLADQENKFVIFDLFRPPRYHPYTNKWINRTLEVILHESKIRPNLVIWLMDLNRSFVQSAAPGLQHASASADSVEELQRRNIRRLNLDYRDIGRINIRKYAEANITINLWVINEPWLFSLAWCYGVHSVTTNAVHSMRDLNEPLFLMTPQNFKSMWIVTDVLAVVLIGLLFGIHWWREVGAYCCEAESNEALETGTYNKFGTELGTVPTVTKATEKPIVA